MCPCRAHARCLCLVDIFWNLAFRQPEALLRPQPYQFGLPSRGAHQLNLLSHDHNVQGREVICNIALSPAQLC